MAAERDGGRRKAMYSASRLCTACAGEVCLGYAHAQPAYHAWRDEMQALCSALLRHSTRPEDE
eukprot:CAMPEP_0198545436 /NCGR_PEP_ID=MMETSP1462-20131121/64033_1 /TAXON_ID=1333877 /ORGANISM="Brandtodinium nutriculum, Strain RCC3387" /LENGTH=62 /DNA_ID=CAMNT_0044275821 /DNA_START=538 /DNA_END=723 /DNA_ORIENTATION=-